MGKIYISDGQRYDVAEHRFEEFLQAHPDAIPYEVESYLDEDIEKATEISIDVESTNETEEQKIANDQKAEDMANYKVPEGKMSIDQAAEIAGVTPVAPLTPSGYILNNTEIGRQIKSGTSYYYMKFLNWLENKDSFTSNVFRKTISMGPGGVPAPMPVQFDFESNDNVITNQEQDLLDQQKMLDVEKEIIAERDKVKVEDLNEEQISEAVENNKNRFREDLANDSWWENTEEIIEADRSWWQLWRGDKQLDERDAALESLERVEEVTKNNMLRYNYHANEITKIQEQFDAIKDKTPQTKEEYEQLQTLVQSLKTQGEKHLASILHIQQQADLVGDNEKDLRNFVDAYGRNYNEITNFFGNLALATGDLVDNIGEAAYKYTDPGALFLAIADSYKAGDEDKSLGIFENVYKLAAWRDGLREDTLDFIWRDWSEDMRNGLEPPQSFGDINNFEEFGEWAAQTTATQLPNTVVMLTTGGYALPILGATSAGAKFKDMQREMEMYGVEYTPGQMYLTATVTGAAEALSEKVTLGQLNKVKGAVKGITKGAKNQVKSGFFNYLKRNFATRKGLGQNIYDPIEEGFTEGLSQVAGNMADKYVLGKDDVNIFDGVTESFFSGLWMSGVVYKSPVFGLNLISGFRTNESKQSVFLNAKRIEELKTFLTNKDLSNNLRVKYREELEDLVAENNDLILKDIKRLDELTPEEKTQILEIEKNKANLVNKANDINADKSLSKEQKKSELNRLKDQYNKIDQQRGEVLAPYVAKEIDQQINTVKAEAERIFQGDVTIESAENEAEVLEILQRENDKKPQNKKQSLAELQKEAKNQGTILQNPDGTQTIIINRDASAKQGATNVAAHEFLHAILFESVKNNPETQKALGKSLQEYLMKINPTKVKNSKFAARLKQYQDAVKAGEYSSANAAEEVLTLFSDAINTGDIVFNENVFTKLKDVFRRVLQAAGVKVKFNTGRDVYNFIKDYNHGILKGKLGKGVTTVAREGAEGKLIKEKTDQIRETVNKSSRAENLSDQVQDTYNKKGIDGAFEITELYRGMAEKIAQKYRDVPGFKEFKDDFVNELLTGKRGVYEMVLKYDPTSGVPLAAYINSFISSRAIEVADRIFGKQFTTDVTEARNITAEDTQVEQQQVEDQPSLREQLGIETGGPLYNRIKAAVIKTFGARLPKVTSKQFKKELQKSFRVELKTAMANLIGTRAIKEQFLRNNFEAIYSALSQEIINKRFNQFAEPVLDENGKPMRQKYSETGDASGKGIFTKRKISKSEWLSYFIGKDVKPSTKGTRKDALAEALAEELAFDATMEVVKDPEVLEKRKAIDDITGVEQVENYIEETAKQINRDPNKKFSLDAKDIQLAGKLADLAAKEDIDNVTNEDGTIVSRLANKFTNTMASIVRNAYNEGLIQPLETYRFLKLVKNSKLIPPEVKEQVKKALTKQSSTELKQGFASDMAMLAMDFGANVLNVIGYDGLGFINRVLDPAKKKKSTGQPGEFYQAIEDIKAQVKDNTDLPPDLDLSKVRPMNSKIGLMAKINKILALDSKAEKLELIAKLEQEIADANVHNKILAKYLMKKLVKSEISDANFINMLQIQTNAVKGFRSLTGLKYITIKEGPQGPMKGEHLADNATSMFDLLELRFQNLDDTTLNNKIDDILEYHDQWLESKSVLDLVDVFGRNNPFKDLRIRLTYPIGNKGDVYTFDLKPAETLIKQREKNIRIKQDVNKNVEKNKKFSLREDALNNARRTDAPRKGISVFDFDDTLARTKSKVIVNIPEQVQKITGTGNAVKVINTVYKGVVDLIAKNKKIESINFSSDATESSRIKLYNTLANKLKKDLGWNLDLFETTSFGKKQSEDFTLKKAKDQKNIKTLGSNLNFTEDTVGNFKSSFEINNRTYNVSLDKKGKGDYELNFSLIGEGKGKTFKIDATRFAKESADLEAAGAKFDFSEFNKVIDGKKGPLADLALKRQEKFGSKDIFVLTARPQESAYAIHAFLKGIGLEIPIENITGLEDGRPQAKADWIISKAAEGYNDFYFADDAYKNVKAVQDALDVVDVKSDVQQAKASMEDIDFEFNKIIEEESGVEAFKEFSNVEAARRGSKVKSKWKYFLPPGAEDFIGLLYDLLAKGKRGEAQLDFFNRHLIKPFSRAIAAINIAKQKIAEDFRNLKKQMPQVKKILGKKSGYKDYTNDQAIRVYIWTKLGIEIPGISKTDQQALANLVAKNDDLRTFADVLPKITRLKEGYPPPAEHWIAGTTASDMNDVVDKVKRKEYLKEFIEKKNIIFSQKNINKLRAIYGDAFVEALQDMLYRMENGTNRSFGRNRTINAWLNWVNNSVGAIMFFNMRSAILQTISSVNFINWSYNNPLNAAKAFANQKQFWKDFAFIFNSPMLKQRRRGLQTDVNEAEIANAAAGAKNKASAVLAYLLKIGFTPTQIADSFAIAIGGASFYRNRIKDLMKQGMSKEEAETQAFEDFAEASEKAQQSSRPDLISAQQSGPLGRIILAFQNTPMQYMRLTKKAMRDLIAGRGDAKTNISKILYYGAVQNFVFASLQNALFGFMFANDEEEEELNFDKKSQRIANNMMDTILRGSGLYGAVASTIKNTIIKFIEQENKGWTGDHAYTIIEALNLSPPIGSKARKLYAAIQTYRFNKDIMLDYGPGLGNPAYEMFGNVVSGVTNLPLDRLFRKINNVRASLDERNAAWQRIATLLGWSTWDVGVEDYEVEELKQRNKNKKKNNKRNNKKVIKKKVIKKK